MSAHHVFFIVPALIRTSEAEHLLNLTLRRVPSSIKSTVIVVSQGRRPRVSNSLPMKVLSIHYDEPLGKWGAITKGSELLPETDTPVVLLDADDSIDSECLTQAVTWCLTKPNALWIGRRDRIELRASDELSPDSRLFFEAFTNTLLLSLHTPPDIDSKDPPDIQSGFLVLPVAALKSVPFQHALSYGGELLLCFHLWAQGFATSEVEYKVHPRVHSTYRLKQIVREAMALPFFSNVTQQQIKEAVSRAPTLYDRYFTKAQKEAYELEVREILNLASDNGATLD